MIFEPLSLGGAYLIKPQAHEDERGLFARTFCAEEFERRGICSVFAQCNTSYNKYRGTLRGMHYQEPPHEEAKLVRCTRGAIFDVIVDIRAESPTHGQWYGADLTATNRHALYIPEGFAHGFITLENDTEVFYQMSIAYVAGVGRTVRWDDPTISIRWPIEPSILSMNDANAAPLLQVKN